MPAENCLLHNWTVTMSTRISGMEGMCPCFVTRPGIIHTGTNHTLLLTGESPPPCSLNLHWGEKFESVTRCDVVQRPRALQGSRTPLTGLTKTKARLLSRGSSWSRPPTFTFAPPPPALATLGPVQPSLTVGLTALISASSSNAAQSRA